MVLVHVDGLVLVGQLAAGIGAGWHGYANWLLVGAAADDAAAA